MDAAARLREEQTTGDRSGGASRPVVQRTIGVSESVIAVQAPHVQHSHLPSHIEPRARLSPLNMIRCLLKRAFDIGASTLGLIVLSPVMAIIWVAVKATSPGPALHTSMRIGRFGRAFMMPKFRTMYVDAPSCARETLDKADQRITPLGRVLRRTGLDELPQLVSVLRGEMSLIGPRPLLASDPGAAERAKFPDALEVRPGISGLAQVSGRNQVSPRRKARLDAFYARKPSLRFDLALLLRTVFVIVTGKGFL